MGRRRHRNNFDLVRLFAALQVALFHATSVLRIHTAWADRLLLAFPGVPIFFVISGFLVWPSFEASHGLGDYAMRRAVRIYPALWVCFAVTIGLLAAYGELGTAFVASWRFPAWVATQALAATHTPPDLRSWGYGTPNPSLWTISVELGFYALVPLLVWLTRRAGSPPRGDAVLVTVLVASFTLGRLVGGDPERAGHLSLSRIILSSPLPHLWIFLLGVLAHRHWQQVRRVLEGWGGWWLAGYTLLAVTVLEASFGGEPGVLPGLGRSVAPVLVGLVALSVAHTAPGLADRVLRGNDVSYGVYLYHFLFVNIVLSSRASASGPAQVAFVLAGSLACASLSWALLERPLLERRLVLGRRAATLAARFRGREPAVTDR